MNDWRELKTLQDVAEAQKNGDEIQTRQNDYQEWHHWFATEWNESRQFRARPRQPKMKQVKMLCYFDGEFLFWAVEDSSWAAKNRVRVPAEDKVIEIPE